MIIKSTSRKDTNFRQIVEYLHKESRTQELAITYVHNMEVFPDDLSGIIRSLEINDSYRRKRKNGVGFYHDIISFAPEDSKVIRQYPHLLRDVMDKYISLRCPHSLVVARPHIDEKHIHIHFIISANEYKSQRSVRISKSELQNIKSQIRNYQNEYYPQIEHGYQEGRVVLSSKTKTHSTWQMEKRGVKQDKKDFLKKIILEALLQSNSWDVLTKYLRAKDIKVYKRRSKIAGIVWKNKKYRFTTLIRMEKEQKKRIELERVLISKNLETHKSDSKNQSSQWIQMQTDLEQLEQKRKSHNRQGVSKKQGYNKSL